ncbi:MAG: drug/metabolite exporter YedA [Gemmatimonadales bacterium]|nr:MAG: drug/metabolite exporter YedA [Gemmatimonadales bacterium]
MTEAERPSTVRLVLAWATVYLVWGSTYLGIRFAIESIPPFLMAGSRHLLAGLLLFSWSRLRQHTGSPTQTDWVRAAGLGVLMLVSANGATTWAEQLVPSGLTALIVATSALWLVLLNWLWLGAARPGARTVGGLVAGFGGVALLVVPGNFAGSEHVDIIGAVVLIGAALSWAVGSIYAIKLPRPTHPTLFVSQQMIVAGVVLLLIATLTGELHGFSFSDVSRTSATAYLYLAIFGSLISFSAYFWLIRHTTPDRLATISYVNPLVAVILGWALAGEPLSLRVLIAAAVILVAVGLITTGRMRPRT